MQMMDVSAVRRQVVVRMAPRVSRADVTAHLGALLETAPSGLLRTSLNELARGAGCDVATVRVAIAALDPADHVVSADVLAVAPAQEISIEWAPVAAVIDLLLDWDLLTVDITVAELSEWLGVSTEVARRAVAWLGATPGVKVRRPALGGGSVRIAVATDRCPLTAEVASAAG
jgi:hypothetical protein